ncbi:MAG: hypothetical protein KJN97_10670 [Deltaproteobacteria bacterium]|nr:hypothetical protein [Deltaproteobacteria bacterium]
MTSPIHRFVTRLSKSSVFGRAVEHLPEEVRDALEYFATGQGPSLIRKGPLCEGDTAQGVAVFLGQVRQGAALRGVNLLRGTITGGTLRGCNVCASEVVDGDVRGVNVLLGDVRGGTVRGINVLIGDVHGGTLDVNILLGNVLGGEVSAKIHVGEVVGGSVKADSTVSSAG